MPYNPPYFWSHGDYPTAARINLYKTGLDAIHDALGDYTLNPTASRRIGTVQGYYLLHKYRWLLYRDAGRIEDPNGVGETVNLAAAEDSGWTSYDLDQVDWMFPGKLYQVQAVISCFEDMSAL